MAVNILEEAQKAHLISWIRTKSRHEKLFRAAENDLVDVEASTTWMTHGCVSAKEEAKLCYLQDRNLFGAMPGNCQHCKERIKSVDHLATQCSRMLGHDYTCRHNEVVRCIHLHLG